MVGVAYSRAYIASIYTNDTIGTHIVGHIVTICFTIRSAICTSTAICAWTHTSRHSTHTQHVEESVLNDLFWLPSPLCGLANMKGLERRMLEAGVESAERQSHAFVKVISNGFLGIGLRQGDTGGRRCHERVRTSGTHGEP